MKRFFLGVVLAFSFVVSASSSVGAVGGDDSPTNVIIGFLDASFKADKDRILALTCNAQRELVRLRFPTTTSAFVQASTVSVDFSEVELVIREQTATQAFVNVSGNLKVSGGGQEAQLIPLAEMLPFPFITTVFEEGKWRVCNSADISLRGLIEAGSTDNSEMADALLCEALVGTVADNPFYQLGKSLGADGNFDELAYSVTEWNPSNGFIKITSGIADDQLNVVNATRVNGEWRICSTPETTMRIIFELAIADDVATASHLVCADQRETVATELQTLRQRITELVDLETKTANPPFYENVAVLIFEAAGVEQRNLRIQVAQVQYALSDTTDTSTTIAFNGNVRVQTIGLLQNIPITSVMPASAQMTRQNGLWYYCPQPVTESTDA